MRTIFKMTGIILGAAAAIALWGCSKQNQVSEPTENDGAVQSETQDPAETQNAVQEESSELPSDEDNGIMPIYGVPDDVEAQPVADTPEPQPESTQDAPVMAIYGMPAN